MNRHGNKFGVSLKLARTFDGIVFDSKLEMNRYAFLRAIEKRGKIKNLQRQVEFVLIHPFIHKKKKYQGIKYYADFTHEIETGDIIVEDAKGVLTKEYQIKKKLLLSIYPEINFYEIRKYNDIGGLVNI